MGHREDQKTGVSSLDHGPLVCHKPRALGIGVFKENTPVFLPEPEGPLCLEGLRCPSKCPVSPFRAPHDPQPSTQKLPPDPTLRGLPPRGFPPPQALSPEPSTPTPPGVAGWTSDSCSASSEGRGPLPVGGHKVRAEAVGSAPGPWSW